MNATSHNSSTKRARTLVRILVSALLLTALAISLGVSAASANDGQGPVATVSISPEANEAGWRNGFVSVRYEWSDPDGIDSENCGTWDAPSSEGDSVYHGARCLDIHGNRGDVSGSIKIDTKPPTTSNLQARVLSPGTGDYEFTFETTDAVSGVKEGATICYLEGESLASSETCSSPYRVSDLPAGAYSLTVKASDVAGNVGNGTNINIIVERGAPTAAPTISPAPNEAGWYSGEVIVSLNWTDDSAPGIDEDNCDHTVTLTEDSAAATYLAECSDLSGNVGVASGEVMVDTTAPETTVTTSVPAFVPLGELRIDFEGTDATSGVVGYECVAGDDAFSIAGPCTSPYVLDELFPGSYRIQFAAIDAAGNIDPTPTVVSFVATEDTTAPVASPSFSPEANAAGWHNTDVTVAFGWDDGDGVGVNSEACNHIAEVAGREGPYVDFGGGCSDLAGNNDIYVGYIAIDTTAPVISFESTPPAASDANDVEFTFSTYETVSGVQQYTCFLSGPHGEPESACSSPYRRQDLPPGDYTFSAVAVDVAGNVGFSDSYEFTILAPEPDPAMDFVNLPSALCAGDTITFSGPDRGAYRVRLGTKPGAKDVANIGGAPGGHVVGELPAGVTIYATLRHREPQTSTWINHSNALFEPCEEVAIEITSHDPGGTICAGDRVTVSGPEIGDYRLRLGTTKSARDIANQNITLDDGYLVNELPATDTIHISLRHRPAGGKWTLQQRFTLTNCVEPAVAITLPADGDTFCPDDVLRISGPGDGRYRIHLGTTVGGKDVLNTLISPNQSMGISDLPAGETIYATLKQRHAAGDWSVQDTATFTACG